MGKRISLKNRKRRRDLASKKKGKARKRNKLSVKQSRSDKQRKANRWN